MVLDQNLHMFCGQQLVLSGRPLLVFFWLPRPPPQKLPGRARTSTSPRKRLGHGLGSQRKKGPFGWSKQTKPFLDTTPVLGVGPASKWWKDKGDFLQMGSSKGPVATGSSWPTCGPPTGFPSSVAPSSIYQVFCLKSRQLTPSARSQHPLAELFSH